jgi:hypothetical protein
MNNKNRKKCKNNHNWFPAQKEIKGKIVKGGLCEDCGQFFPFDLTCPVTPRHSDRINRRGY